MKNLKQLMVSLTLAAAVLSAGTACAQEADALDGEIRAGVTRTIAAPYTGTVGDFAVRAGDEMRAGDVLFALGAQDIYADFDGTVTAVFAGNGDSAAAVQAYYGALLYIERDVLYTGACSTSGAASDNENKLVHPGEWVYIRSTNESKRKGRGRVLGVQGSSYTIEVTYSDDLRVGESIKVYRESDYDSDSCIGSGRLERVDPVAVTAEGHVLAVDVEEGQRVRRGDRLLRTVPEAPLGRRSGTDEVTMPEDGVLLSVSAQSGVRVSQDDVLATYCPAGAMELVCSVDENDLASLAVGMEASVELDGAPGESIRARLERISRTANDRGEYDVTFSLEQSDALRIGMNATATLK